MKEIISRFDRSYIINLRNCPHRKREVIVEFARAGIPLPHPKIEFYTAERPTEQGKFPTLEMRGNFTSHLEVHRLSMRDGPRNVVVFEDEVAFRQLQEM